MLYIDGIMMKHLKNELNSLLSGKKIGKIYQYDNNTISIFFGKNNLNISINPELPIVYISDTKEDGAKNPPNFCLVLRKFLSNGILTSVEQQNSDRILIFNFSVVDEIGDKNCYKLVVEIMGKHSNLFLVDSQFKIIDLLKRFSIEENRLRVLMPGIFYKFPVISQKKDPYSISKEYYDSEILSSADLNKKIEGFGSFSSKEAFGSFESYSSFLNKVPTPIMYLNENKITFASFIPFKEFELYESISFDSVNELINSYIEKSINSRSFNELKKKLDKVVSDELKKIKNSIKFNEKDKEKYSKYENYKNIGDILAANLYSMKFGMKEVSLYDFYSNEEIKIQLNPEKSPADNMKIYYDKFSKFKRGYNFNLERALLLEDELNYLNSVSTFISAASDLSELAAIENELADLKYIKKSKDKKGKKIELPAIQEFVYSENIKILAGKNNKANDYLTMKLADRNDIWLHVKDIPGSHVVIKSLLNDEIEDSVILKAAKIAAYFSSAKGEKAVSVDYTYRKYVKKPSGAKPGFVTYTNEKNIYVSPSIE